MKFGSLFSGIGGFDLGFERAGLECRWQVEIDDYCRRVLAKHWPNVPRYGDIKELRCDELESVDLICGGFPCQDVSNSGKRAGIAGERSGLWSEYLRLISELRPRYVLVENVPGLYVRGLGRVLGDLAEIGYDAEWDCIPAAAIGAPHIRERLFIFAYPGREPGNFRRASIYGRDELVEQSRDWQEKERGAHRKLYSLVSGIYPRTSADWWRAQSRMDRSSDGVPARMDRLRGLGNAVVPQVAEWLGRRIVAAA